MTENLKYNHRPKQWLQAQIADAESAKSSKLTADDVQSLETNDGAKNESKAMASTRSEDAVIRMTASPRKMQTQIAKISYAPGRTQNTCPTPPSVIESIAHIPTILTPNSQATYRLSSPEYKKTQTQAEFSKRKFERELEIQEIKKMLSEIGKSPKQSPKGSKADSMSIEVDPKEAEVARKQAEVKGTENNCNRGELGLKRIEMESNQEQVSTRSFRRCQTDLNLKPVAPVDMTRRTVTRTNGSAGRSKSSQPLEKHLRNLSQAPSDTAKNRRASQETRRVIDEKTRRKRSNIAAAALIQANKTKTALEKEKIKQRLEELRKNTRKIVSKNVERKQTESKTSVQVEESSNVNAKQESSVTVIQEDSNKPMVEINTKKTRDSKKEQDMVDKRRPAPKPARASSRSVLMVENQKRIGILRKTDTNDHSFSAIKEFNYDKENVVLEMLTPKITLPPESRLKDIPKPSEIPQIAANTVHETQPNPSVFQLAMPEMLFRPEALTATEHCMQVTEEKTLGPGHTERDTVQPQFRGEHTKNVDLPYWLKPSTVQVYPYNFIMAVRRKLESIANPSQLQNPKLEVQRTVIQKHQNVETALTIVSKDNLAGEETEEEKNEDDSFATHTVDVGKAPSTKSLASQMQSFTENAAKSQTLSELSSNFSSISLHVPISNTISALASLKSEGPKSYPESKKKSRVEDDDTTVSSSIFSSPEKKSKSEMQSQRAILGEKEVRIAVQLRPVSPLSVERIGNLKIASNRRNREEPVAVQVKSRRGDAFESTKELENKRQIFTKESEVNFNNLLDEFNRSLSQVIEVNEKLKNSLDKSHHIFTPVNTSNTKKLSFKDVTASSLRFGQKNLTSRGTIETGKECSISSNSTGIELRKLYTQGSTPRHESPLLSPVETGQQNFNHKGSEDSKKAYLINSLSRGSDKEKSSSNGVIVIEEECIRINSTIGVQNSSRVAVAINPRLHGAGQKRSSFKDSKSVDMDGIVSPTLTKGGKRMTSSKATSATEEDYSNDFESSTEKSSAEKTSRLDGNQVQRKLTASRIYSFADNFSTKNSSKSSTSTKTKNVAAPIFFLNLSSITNSGTDSTESRTVNTEETFEGKSEDANSAKTSSGLQNRLQALENLKADLRKSIIRSKADRERQEETKSDENIKSQQTQSTGTLKVNHSSQRTQKMSRHANCSTSKTTKQLMRAAEHSKSKSNSIGIGAMEEIMDNKSGVKKDSTREPLKSIDMKSTRPVTTSIDFVKTHVNNLRGDFVSNCDDLKTARSRERAFQAVIKETVSTNSSGCDSVAPPSYNSVSTRATPGAEGLFTGRLLNKLKDPVRSSIEGSNETIGSEIVAIFNKTDMDGISIVSSINGSISDTSVNYSNLGLYEQLIQNETTKSEHLTVLLKMREKALLDRTKGQIAWLEVQKEHYKAKGLSLQISVIRKKQRAILLKMEREREDIKRILQSTSSSISAQSSTQQRLSTASTNTSDSPQSKKTNASSPALLRPCPSLPLPLSKPSKSRIAKQKPPAENLQFTPTASIVRANYALESSRSLEDLLQRREEILRRRRAHVERLMQWHRRLDEEEAEVLELERMLLNSNNEIPVLASREQDELLMPSNPASSEITPPTPKQRLFAIRAKMERRLMDIDSSLRDLNGISTQNGSANTATSNDETSKDYVRITGRKLNKLWSRLTSQHTEKFDSSRRYKLYKSDLEQLYEEAKVAVLNDFAEDEERCAAELLEKSIANLSANNNQSQGAESACSRVEVPSLNLNFSSGRSEQNDDVCSTSSAPHTATYSPSAAEDFMRRPTSKTTIGCVSQTDSESCSGRELITNDRHRQYEENEQRFNRLRQRLTWPSETGRRLQRSISDTQIAMLPNSDNPYTGITTSQINISQPECRLMFLSDENSSGTINTQSSISPVSQSPDVKPLQTPEETSPASIVEDPYIPPSHCANSDVSFRTTNPSSYSGTPHSVGTPLVTGSSLGISLNQNSCRISDNNRSQLGECNVNIESFALTSGENSPRPSVICSFGSTASEIRSSELPSSQRSDAVSSNENTSGTEAPDHPLTDAGKAEVPSDEKVSRQLCDTSTKVVADTVVQHVEEPNSSGGEVSYTNNFEKISNDWLSPSDSTPKSASMALTLLPQSELVASEESKSDHIILTTFTASPETYPSKAFNAEPNSLGSVSGYATEFEKSESDDVDEDVTRIEDLSFPQFETTVDTTHEEEEEEVAAQEFRTSENIPLPPPPPPDMMPDIINELEIRRCQQMLLETELKQYEQVTAVPYMYMREIPNKPPPPYVPPAHGSPMTTIFPSEERIKDITYRRAHELYCELLKTDCKNSKGEELSSVLEENITNIYERIILDICREYLTERREVLTKGDPCNFHSPLAFFNPPDRIFCIQEAIYKEVRRSLAMDKATPKRREVYSVYGQRARRDYIGQIIIQEMYDEDDQWCNFHREEFEVIELIIDEMVDHHVQQIAMKVLVEEGYAVEKDTKKELRESEVLDNKKVEKPKATGGHETFREEFKE